MKAVDLYAAHALLSYWADPPENASFDAAARFAVEQADALAEQMCATRACSIVDGRCERCGQGTRPPAPKIPPKRIG